MENTVNNEIAISVETVQEWVDAHQDTILENVAKDEQHGLLARVVDWEVTFHTMGKFICEGRPLTDVVFEWVFDKYAKPAPLSIYPFIILHFYSTSDPVRISTDSIWRYEVKGGGTKIFIKDDYITVAESVEELEQLMRDCRASLLNNMSSYVIETLFKDMP
jgi:hypothetical protein